MNNSPQKTYQVNEIFYSLQGEGFWTGTPALFLRMAGCNLKCSFCDTDHSHGLEMTTAEIVEAIRKYPARHIVITGGEPTLQIDGPLLQALKDADFFVQIETNGTVALPEPVLALIDWVTLSPKDRPVALQRVDELKVVYQQQDFSQYVHLMPKEKGRCFVQPCDFGQLNRNIDNLKKAIEFVESHPQWRLSLQTHKLLSIR